jgi:hypothetical protein
VVSVEPAHTRLEVQQGGVEVTPKRGRSARVSAARQALVTADAVEESGAGRRVLFVHGTDNKDRRLDGELLLQRRLERLGFSVTARTETEATSTDGRAAGLVYISSSVYADRISTRFRDTDVPVVVAEPWLLDDLGMTAAGREDNQAYWTRDLVIVRPDHPLAAGLSGPVTVAAAPVLIAWGRPNAVATTVGAFRGNLQQASLFAYEKGAAMPGLAAPASRVFIFLHDGTPLDLNDAGWGLFDAAIRWAVE